jgi:hypothetical protein
MQMKFKKKFSWRLQILVAVIIGQSLFFKFTGHPESVKIFLELGMEPHGRILIGILELIVIFLILIPPTVVFGAMLTIGLMSGAIVSHFTTLGWSDGRGSLGALAVVSWLLGAAILYLRKESIVSIWNRFHK